MKNIEEIELQPAETTAYWWTRSIREKVREIVIEGANSKIEANFANIFINFSEKDYRNLYIELSKLIKGDIENFVPENNTTLFSQDTEKGQHNRIIEELSRIVNKKVPDIRLAGNGVKDSIIYTNMFNASVWYKSCGVIDLPKRYNSNYILTGDEDELKFYNTLLSTIFILNQYDESFNSTQQLKNHFCTQYAKDNELEDLELVKSMFDVLFNRASDRKIIFVESHERTYFPDFKKTDYAGLDEYMYNAKNYANIILNDSKDYKLYVKKLNKEF